MTSGNLQRRDRSPTTDDDAVDRLAASSTACSATIGRSTSAATTPSCAAAAMGGLQVLRRSRGYAPRAAGARRWYGPADPGRGRRAQEHGRRGDGDDGGGQPPHRRPRAPRHLPLVPAGHRPPLRPLRRRAGGRGPRPAPRVPLDEAGRSTSTSRRRRAAPPRPRRRRAWSSTAAPDRCSASPSTASATAPTARSGAASSSWPTSTGSSGSATSRPCTMPGGVAAIREPWRMAVAWAHAAGVDDPGSSRRAPAAVLDLVERGRGPVTTSVGRLFDAVAALLGVRAGRHLRGAGRHRAGGAGPHGAPRRGTATRSRSAPRRRVVVLDPARWWPRSCAIVTRGTAPPVAGRRLPRGHRPRGGRAAAVAWRPRRGLDASCSPAACSRTSG